MTRALLIGRETGALETAVNGLDDPILLIQRNAQGVQCFSGAAVGADQCFAVLTRKGGMASVFLTTFGADACVAGIFFHNHIPSLL